MSHLAAAVALSSIYYVTPDRYRDLPFNIKHVEDSRKPWGTGYKSRYNGGGGSKESKEQSPRFKRSLHGYPKPKRKKKSR